MLTPYLRSSVVWPPLAAAIFLAALSYYSWRRRAIPGALPLAVGSFLGVLWLVGMVMEALAPDPQSKIAWRKFQAVWQLPAVTATTCFALEYARPGRWLTRRNVALLSIPPLIAAVLVVANDARWMWLRFEPGSGPTKLTEFALPGLILAAYGLGLIAVNAAAFLWLFARSPQHRWPVALMLFGEVTARLLYTAGLLGLWSTLSPDPVVAGITLVWSTYAIALFGFRILDPLSAAQKTVMRQMREGMVVFDESWRVVSVNPAAEAIFGAAGSDLRGQTWAQMLATAHPQPDVARLAEAVSSEMTLGAAAPRAYAVNLSPLRDPRDLHVGSLLLLLDVTEQRSAQAQAQEQQRILAVIRERERLARELHDNLGQVLAFISAQSQAAQRLLNRGDTEGAGDALVRLTEVAQEASTDVREAILGLRIALAEQGLMRAVAAYLEQYQRRYGIRAELSAPPELYFGAFAPSVEAQVLPIIQEALTNARKHSGARAVRVAFQMRADSVVITVQDDGCGFQPHALPRERAGVGLRVMRERAEEIGGGLDVRSVEGQGAEVLITVPRRAPAGG